MVASTPKRPVVNNPFLEAGAPAPSSYGQVPPWPTTPGEQTVPLPPPPPPRPPPPAFGNGGRTGRGAGIAAQPTQEGHPPLGVGLPLAGTPLSSQPVDGPFPPQDALAGPLPQTGPAVYSVSSSFGPASSSSPYEFLARPLYPLPAGPRSSQADVSTSSWLGLLQTPVPSSAPAIRRLPPSQASASAGAPPVGPPSSVPSLAGLSSLDSVTKELVGPLPTAAGRPTIVSRTVDDIAGRAAERAPRGASAEALPASGPADATSAALVPDMKQIASTLTALSDFFAAVPVKLFNLKEAVSSANAKLESHGQAIENLGSLVSGLQTFVNSLKSNVLKRLPAGTAANDGSDAEEEDTSAALFFSDEEPKEPTEASKVRRVGIRAADVKTLSLQKALVKQAQAEADARVLGMNSMIAIRRVLNDTLTVSLSSATTAAAVYRDNEAFADLILESTKQHMGSTDAEARAFLKSTISQPMKHRGGAVYDGSPSLASSSSSDDTKAILGEKLKATPVAVRAIVPLQAVQPHLIEAIKKRVIVAFCRHVGLPVSKLTLMKALEWLSKLEYTKSDDGQKALCAGVVVMYEYLGATDRIQAGGVGSGKVVSMSIGHYALASCVVRHFLEAAVSRAYNKSTRRTSAEPGMYVRWRTSLQRVDKFLLSDSEAHNGIILVDGPDQNRAVLHSSDDDMVNRLYKIQTDDDERYERLLQRFKAETLTRLTQAAATDGDVPGVPGGRQ